MALRSMLGGVLPASQLGWIFSQAGQIKREQEEKPLLAVVRGRSTIFRSRSIFLAKKKTGVGTFLLTSLEGFKHSPSILRKSVAD
eukprot:scaffold10025_cov180-Amphora_coffeaeformis.AAC.3